MIEEIINQGAMVTIPDIVGWTALHVACFYKRADVILLLLKNGANLLTKDRDKLLCCDLVLDDPDCVEVIANYLTLLGNKKLNNVKIANNDFNNPKSINLNTMSVNIDSIHNPFLKKENTFMYYNKKKQRERNMSFSEKNLVEVAQLGEANQQIRDKYKFIPKKHTFCNTLKKSLKLTSSNNYMNNVNDINDLNVHPNTARQEIVINGKNSSDKIINNNNINNNNIDIRTSNISSNSYNATGMNKKNTWDMSFPVANNNTKNNINSSPYNKNRNSINIIQNSMTKEDQQIKSSHDFFYKANIDEDKMLDERVVLPNTFNYSISVPKVFPKTKNFNVLDKTEEEKRNYASSFAEGNKDDDLKIENKENIEGGSDDLINAQANSQFAKYLETKNSEDSFVFDYNDSSFDFEDEPIKNNKDKKDNKNDNTESNNIKGVKLGKFKNSRKMRNRSLVDIPTGLNDLNDSNISNIKDTEINLNLYINESDKIGKSTGKSTGIGVLPQSNIPIINDLVLFDDSFKRKILLNDESITFLSKHKFSDIFRYFDIDTPSIEKLILLFFSYDSTFAFLFSLNIFDSQNDYEKLVKFLRKPLINKELLGINNYIFLTINFIIKGNILFNNTDENFSNTIIEYYISSFNFNKITTCEFLKRVSKSKNHILLIIKFIQEKSYIKT